MKADSWTGWVGLDWKPGRGLRNDPGSLCPLKDVATEAQRRGESFQGHTAFGMQPEPEVYSLWSQHSGGGLGGRPRGARSPAETSGSSPVGREVTRLQAAGSLLLASPSSASSNGSSQVETVPCRATVPESEASPSLSPPRAGMDPRETHILIRASLRRWTEEESCSFTRQPPNPTLSHEEPVNNSGDKGGGIFWNLQNPRCPLLQVSGAGGKSQGTGPVWRVGWEGRASRRTQRSSLGINGRHRTASWGVGIPSRGADGPSCWSPALDVGLLMPQGVNAPGALMFKDPWSHSLGEL